MPRHQHYEHVGAFYHPALGETFTPSTVTFMDVRAGTSIISRGAKSDAVGQLQSMLNKLKFRDSAGKVTTSQIREIAEKKMVDLNAHDIEAAMKMIVGSARSMGLQVVEG